DQPPHRQRRATLRTDFDRDLVGRATDAPALDLYDRLQIRERLLEHVEPRLAGPLLYEVHGPIKEPLGHRLLPLKHHRIDELRYRLTVVTGVGQNRTLDGLLSSAHGFFPPAAAPPPPPARGFLVPYLERLWFRPVTPDASRLPRTM